MDSFHGHLTDRPRPTVNSVPRNQSINQPITWKSGVIFLPEVAPPSEHAMPWYNSNVVPVVMNALAAYAEDGYMAVT